MAETAVAH